MKHFTFIIITLLFCFSNITAQTQLSHFVSEHSDTKNIVKHIEGKNYLLSFYQNDELGVSEIISIDSIKLLHNRYFQGIYENGYIKFFGKHLVFEIFSGLIIYDFINDSYIEKTINYPVEHIYNDYPSDTDFLSIVRAKDTSLWYKYIIDFNGNITDTIISGTIYNRKGENLIIGKYEYQNKKYTYAYQNYKTNTVDTLFSIYNSRSLFCLDTAKMWYQDNNNNVVEYEYDTGTKTLFQGVNSYNSYYHYIFKLDNKLYLYNYGRDDNITHIQIFDINTKQKINEINIKDIERIKNKQFYVYEDNIVLCNDYDEIVIIDPETKKDTIFEMYITPNKLQILDGGKILTQNTKWHEGYIFNYIDIDSQTSKTLYGNYRIESERHDFVKTGNNFIGSFYENHNGRSVFVMNIDSLKYYPADKFDKTNSGFEYNSKIAEINGKIMVLADNVYEVNDDTLTQINEKTINSFLNNKYSIQNNKIYFSIYEGEFPNSYYNLYSYDTDKIKREMRFKTSWDILNVKRYFDVGNYIYFTSNGELYKYNKSNSSIELIDRIKSIIFEENNFVQRGDTIYYTNEDLKMIVNNKSPIVIGSNTNFSFLDYILKFKNRLFWIGNNGFYEIKGDKVEKINFNDPNDRVNIFMDKAQKNILYVDHVNGVFHYDGNEFIKIIDSADIYGASPAIGESFILKKSLDSRIYYYYYDCVSKEITELPPDKIEGRYLDAFVSNGDSILLTKQWSNPKDILYIYRATNKFSDLELIKEFQNAGKGNYAKFENFGNEGMLYTGDIIALMDENLDFHLLEGIKGDYKHPEIINKNGDLYFLAIEKTTGRQLYKTTLYSYRPNNTTNFQFNYLKLVPNPVKDIIHLKNTEINGKSYFFIYNISGKLIMQNKLFTPEINVSGLKSGMYILQIRKSDKSISGKFIKY